MDYWTLKKKAMMGAMQSGKVTEAEGYPLNLENAIKGNLKDYKIWGNKKGKNLFNSNQLLQASSWQYNEQYYYGSVGNLWNKFAYNNRRFNVYIPYGKRIAISFEGRNLAITQPTFSFIIKYTDGTTTTSAYIKSIEWSYFSIVSNPNKIVDCITCGYQYGDTIYLRNIQIAEVDESGAVPEYEPYQENDGLGAFSGNLLSVVDRNVVTVGTIGNYIGTNNMFVGVARNDNKDPQGYTQYEILDNGFSVTPTWGYYGLGFDFKVNAGEEYSISYSATANFMVAVSFYDANKTYVSNVSLVSTRTFVVPDGISYMLFSFASTVANQEVVFTDVMIAKGSEATEYRPYNYIDVVNSGKNLLKATDVYKGASNYQELVEDGRNCIKFVDNSDASYYYPFKEKTQYTVSFDCKTTVRSTANTQGSSIFRFFYSDGTSTQISVSQNTDWKRRELKSAAGKTIVSIGIASYNYTNWCYIDVDTFQLEEGAETTPYEPYIEPITTTIDLTGHNSIMPNEYIDFKNQAIVRSDGTEEDIILPKIPVFKGYNILTASDAELEATNMYGKYLKKG